MTRSAGRRAACAAALGLCARAAMALTLGDVDLRSAPGQPLDARIPVAAGREALSGACFSIAPSRAGTSPSIPDATLELRRSAHGAHLLVRSTNPVGGPRAGIAISVNCPGASGPAERREFAFDFAAAAPQAPSPSRAAPVAVLSAREGDTLESIARDIFYGDREARRRYVAALRRANPALATLGGNEALPGQATVALPDLHAFARSLPPRQSHIASNAHGAPHGKPSRTAPPRVPPPMRARAVLDSGFRLKLSGPVLDLTPSRGMDASSRARLRERLLALDDDDRTAALLAMRETIHTLESRVAELQLKLARMPAPSAAPPAPARAQPVMAQPVTARAVPKAASTGPWYTSPWMLPAALAALAVLIALGLLRRARASAEAVDEGADEGPITVQVDAAPAEDAPAQGVEPAPVHVPAAQEPAPAVATRVPVDDEAELRRRYIEERFPEVVNGALVLEDPESVVKAARLLYEDGAIPRAVELLQFAIERDPGQMKPWLALFQLFRLEGLAGEFDRLARRFEERHAASDEWRKVRALGAAMDPENPRYAGGGSGERAEAAADDWLRAPAEPADATLAASLRGELMASAAMNERDLIPDPTPALRRSQPFDVA